METKQIEQEALHLPVKDRARLANRLLESLDDVSESDAEQLWLEEARRRVAEIDGSQVLLVSENELEYRIKKRLE